VRSTGIEEAAMEDPLNRRWRRSRRCSSGACVEVAVDGGTVGVRNSTEPDVIVTVPRSAFDLLIRRLKRG
jgi:hypothetical protein